MNLPYVEQLNHKFGIQWGVWTTPPLSLSHCQPRSTCQDTKCKKKKQKKTRAFFFLQLACTGDTGGSRRSHGCLLRAARGPASGAEIPLKVGELLRLWLASASQGAPTAGGARAVQRGGAGHEGQTTKTLADHKNIGKIQKLLLVKTYDPLSLSDVAPCHIVE